MVLTSRVEDSLLSENTNKKGLIFSYIYVTSFKPFDLLMMSLLIVVNFRVIGPQVMISQLSKKREEKRYIYKCILGISYLGA